VLVKVSHLTPSQRSTTWECNHSRSIVNSLRTDKWWAPFGEIVCVLKGQIRGEAIVLLVPTRPVIFGQSKGLNHIACLVLMINRLLTPQTLPLGHGGSHGSGMNAGHKDASRK